MGAFSDKLHVSAQLALVKRVEHRARTGFPTDYKPLVEMPPERDAAARWAEHAISRLAPKRSRIRNGRVQRFRKNPNRATTTLILSPAALSRYPFRVENLRPINPIN